MTNLRRNRWIALSRRRTSPVCVRRRLHHSMAEACQRRSRCRPRRRQSTSSRCSPELRLRVPWRCCRHRATTARWFVVEQGGRVRVFNNSPTVTHGDELHRYLQPRDFQRRNRACSAWRSIRTFPVDPRVFLFYSHTDASTGLVSRLSEFLHAGRRHDARPRLPSRSCSSSTSRKTTTTAATSRSVATASCTSASATAAAATISTAPSATRSRSRRCSARCCASMSTSVPAHCSTAFRSTTLSRSTHRVHDDGTGTSKLPGDFRAGFRNPVALELRPRRTAISGSATSARGAIEEVDRVTLGGNYGWRCFEGTRDTGLACGSPTNLQAPVAEYGNPGLGSSGHGRLRLSRHRVSNPRRPLHLRRLRLRANLEHREHDDAHDGHDRRLQFRAQHLVIRRRERRRAVCRRLRRTPVSYHRLKSSGIRFPCASLRSARSACRWSR